MTRVSFFVWDVQLDAEATAAATAAAMHRLRPLDPRCSSPCRTLFHAIKRGAFPRVVEEFLTLAGVDLQLIQEVYGTPEEGFLAGWWIFIGKLVNDAANGNAEMAFIEPMPGFTCWLEKCELQLPQSFNGHDVLRLEFEWRSLVVQTFGEWS